MILGAGFWIAALAMPEYYLGGAGSERGGAGVHGALIGLATLGPAYIATLLGLICAVRELAIRGRQAVAGYVGLVACGLPTLAVLAWLTGMFGSTVWASSEPSPNDPPATIRLVIDYGDGVEKHFTRLPWQPGMTVFDGLTQAGKMPHGISLESKDYGSGVGVLITRIDDLENQRGGTDGRNWVYEVNGEKAKVSCGKRELEAGDAVRWVFDSWTP